MDAEFFYGIGLMILFFFTSLLGLFAFNVDPVALWFAQMAIAILITASIWGWT